MELKILHLYPDLLNLYGDKGNIECMKKRLEWRGIDVTVQEYTNDSSGLDLSDVDIVFLGGGSDREQKIVCSRLLAYKGKIKEYVENDGVFVAVCGGYQLMGKEYRMENETVEGLGILDISTVLGKKRLIGDCVIKSELIDGEIVGFENHGGRTDIGNHTPLGKVVCGYGNDEKSGYEGVVCKNVVATYLHGPLFPKNPKLCDYILEKALNKKYPGSGQLTPLDDTMEITANKYICDRCKK